MTQPDDTDQALPPARPSLFLERQSYRRRRLMDAARLLPFLGAAMIALPLLWPDDSGGVEAVPLSGAILYVFACWFALIAISVVFGFAARRLAAGEQTEAEPEKWQR